MSSVEGTSATSGRCRYPVLVSKRYAQTNSTKLKYLLNSSLRHSTAAHAFATHRPRPPSGVMAKRLTLFLIRHGETVDNVAQV